MNVLGRDGNEWTLIWPDDEERNTVSVANGHGVPPEHGWTMIPVVRAGLHRGAVAAEDVERLLSEASTYFAGDHLNAGVVIGEVRKRLRALVGEQ